MIPLIWTILVLHVVIFLVNTIGATTIDSLVRIFPVPHSAMHTHLTKLLQIWNIYLRLPTSLQQTAQEQRKLKREVVQLKREMNNTSSQDEFAKWAKLRRRHDKALSDYEALSMFRPLRIYKAWILELD